MMIEDIVIKYKVVNFLHYLPPFLKKVSNESCSEIIKKEESFLFTQIQEFITKEEMEI